MEFGKINNYVLKHLIKGVVFCVMNLRDESNKLKETLCTSKFEVRYEDNVDLKLTLVTTD